MNWIWRTTGAYAAQALQAGSRNSTSVTGAFFGPYTGECARTRCAASSGASGASTSADGAGAAMAAGGVPAGDAASGCADGDAASTGCAVGGGASFRSSAKVVSPTTSVATRRTTRDFAKFGSQAVDRRAR